MKYIPLDIHLLLLVIILLSPCEKDRKLMKSKDKIEKRKETKEQSQRMSQNPLNRMLCCIDRLTRRRWWLISVKKSGSNDDRSADYEHSIMIISRVKVLLCCLCSKKYQRITESAWNLRETSRISDLRVK